MNGIDSGATFELFLSEVASEDSVWKGVVRTGYSAIPGFSGGTEFADKSANSIIERLTMDGLIAPAGKTAQ